MLLTDALATADSIHRNLDALRSKGSAGDWYVIVLSGHAGLHGNQWRFLTQDNRHVTDKTILDLADDLAKAGKKVLVLIDACHAGQLRYAGSDVLNRHADPQKGGIILMISSMSEQLSSALGRYSAFARAVEEGLRGDADYDGDGSVTLKEIRRFSFNRVYELRLLNRRFPGLPVDAQDSVIDASLSFDDGTRLVDARKPPSVPPVDDGPVVLHSVLSDKTWKVSMPASGFGPPVTYELRLDPFGNFFAIQKEGGRSVKIGSGAFKTFEKSVRLFHQHGIDRLEILAQSPTELRFRFQGADFQAVSDVKDAVFLIDATGRLSQEGPRDRVKTRSPSRVHDVRLEGGQKYLIDLVSPEFDTYLRVEDSQGNPLAEDDDGGEDRNSRLMFAAPTTGAYRIVVTSFDGAGGTYHLHVVRASDGPAPAVRPVPASTEKTLDFATGSASASDRLAVTDPVDAIRLKSFQKAYWVNLEASRRIAISLLGEDFDPYVRVEDANRRPIAFSMCSDRSRTAELGFDPPHAGMYRIVVSSARAGAEGAFSLSIRSAPRP